MVNENIPSTHREKIILSHSVFCISATLSNWALFSNPLVAPPFLEDSGTFYSGLYVMCSDHTEAITPLPFPCEFFTGQTPLWFLCDLLGASLAALFMCPLPTLISSPRMLWQPLELVWNTFFCPIKISPTLENIAFLTVALDPPFVSALLFCFRC